MKNGFFITIEGGEGSGKTTQVEYIKNWLGSHNIQFVVTREPGGTNFGESLREILKHATYHIAPMAEAFIFNASRSQLVDNVIKPALQEGKVVFADRYFDSTLAYQGMGRGLGFDKIYNLCLTAVDNLEPDLTIWLDIDPVIAFKRKGGADVNDRIEMLGEEFHKNVYKGYLKICKKFKNRVVRIDATKDLESVSKEIDKVLSARLKKFINKK